MDSETKQADAIALIRPTSTAEKKLSDKLQASPC